jgi:hypothetical protein
VAASKNTSKTTSLPVSMVRRIDELAAAEDRDRSAMACILIEEAIRARAGRPTALRSPYAIEPPPEPMFVTSLALTQVVQDHVRGVMISERRDSRNQVLAILLEEGLDARDVKRARLAQTAKASAANRANRARKSA